MITAKDARKYAKRDKFDSELREIENKLDYAIEKGRFSADYTFSKDIPQKNIKQIIRFLQKNGYKTIVNYKGYGDAMFPGLTINWFQNN